MIRCPVCESATVRIELNRTRRARCSTCAARWIQEGSWQRQVRPHQPILPFTEPLFDLAELEADVVALPTASEVRVGDPDVDEALA